MGILPAWLVTTCEFGGRRILSWALILPLAIPTYIAAFVFYQGPEAAIPLLIQVRQRFGVDAFLLTEQVIRYGLLILMLAAVLYPYVYLACFSGTVVVPYGHSAPCRRIAVIEAARCLGDSPARAFVRAALPMARPGIVAGVALVIMEVINDYGAVHFFGVPTLTEGVFRTWFGMGDKIAALRLAGIMMLVVAVLLALEQGLRGRARYVEADAGGIPLRRVPLAGAKAALAFLLCVVPVALGFLYPVARLGHWAGLHFLSDAGGFPAGAALGRGFGLALVTAVMLRRGRMTIALDVAGLFDLPADPDRPGTPADDDVADDAPLRRFVGSVRCLVAVDLGARRHGGSSLSAVAFRFQSMPWVWSQSSSRAICHSFDPRSGVMWSPLAPS